MHAELTGHRRIEPRSRPDGTPDDNDRVEIGPTALAFEEWAAADIEVPNLARLRAFRLERLAAGLRQRELDGVLLFDPLNIRYASDTTNMQLWATHNPFRACFVSADGYMIVWDYKASTLLTGFNPLVRETRSGASFFYFATGDHSEQHARRFAGEVIEVLAAHGRGTRSRGNFRLAVDKIQIDGLRALEHAGIAVIAGESLMERTRAIKGEDEIHAMRCAMHACERSIAEMEAVVTPGMTENDVWAELHASNIRRGGEWIETRLLTSGPRTNPWFQECGPRTIQAGELLAFDTDLIGCYGMCCDLSRTWLIGDLAPTAEQGRLYREAYEQIMHNRATLAPGRALSDVVADTRPLPTEYRAGRYSCVMHGVGLCDEWPMVKYPEDFQQGEFDLVLEPGMMLCVEAYIGAEGGHEGVKLEDQVLITETGIELLSHYPFDARLLDET